MRLSGWLTALKVCGFAGRAQRRTARASFPAGAEVLEERVLLSGIKFKPSDGRIIITGTTGNDTVEVGYDAGGDVLVTLETPDGSVSETFAAAQVAELIVRVDAGDDVVRNLTTIPATVHGGDGHDDLSGGSGGDLLNGNAGNDRLQGHGGNDTLQAGGGRDSLFGDAGDDLLNGGGGSDLLEGGDGDDLADGQGGSNDTVRGGAGHDVLLGGNGADLLEGGDGRDVLIGGLGADQLLGGPGEDILIGAVTDFDGDDAALSSIRNIWTAAATYEDRLATLEDEQAAVYLQSTETVHDDNVSDDVFGDAERDWFFLTGDPGPEWGVGGGHHGGDGQGDPDFHPSQLDELPDLDDAEAVNSVVPHVHQPVHRAEHFATFALVPYDAVTHTAVQSGPWTDAQTWEQGLLPGNEANVFIPRDIVVTIDGVFDDALRTVRVDGTLRFATTVDTQLKVDTLIVAPSGAFEMGTAVDPIPAGVTARLLIADRGPIDRAWDPQALSRGMVNHGVTTIYGAATTSFLPLAVAPSAGQTTLTLTAAPVNWNVGDEIVIAGTSHSSHQDEVRQILAINGTEITVAPLDYDHLVPEPGLQVHVAHLTRNAVVESESHDLDSRGHLMFMHTRNVDINYAGFYHLGRTDKLTVVDDSVLDENGALVPGTGTNPRARYSVHFHRNGVVDDGNPSRVHGSVVAHDPGWAYTNHSSFVDFTDNVAYDIGGAGFVTEAGDEIGAFRRNISIRTLGSGERINARRDIQDFAHQGDGFWFQSPGVVVEDNVAAGHDGAAFIYYTRGLIQDGLGLTEFHSDNLQDPSIAGGAETIHVAHVPILDFRNNVAYASTVGGAVWYHLLDEIGKGIPGVLTHDQPGVFEDFVGWNNKLGVNIPYTRQLILRDLNLIGDVDNPKNTGVKQRITTTGDITYENLRVVGFDVGVEVPFRGTNVIDGGYYNNVRSFLIETAWEAGREVWFTGDLTFGTLSPQALAGRTQFDIVMQADFSPVAGSVEHVFFVDTVVLDYGAFENQQLFFHEQSRNAVPFPTASADVPTKYVGKTNEHLFNQFGKRTGGAFAPDVPLAVPEIDGLVAP